jgi:hypothetical protein
MASTLRAVIIIACLLSQVQKALSKICYESTGLESKQYFDCDPGAQVSSCCRPGDICYSNGLCTPGPTEDQGVTPFYWHGCSDPTFKDPSCFSACFPGRSIQLLAFTGVLWVLINVEIVAGDGVVVCPQAGPNEFCCYGFGGPSPFFFPE